MKRHLGLITTDFGFLEYSIMGKGEPILVMHGGHSNCDEEFGYNPLIKQGYSLLTPSRAGYGKTSKVIGRNLDTACRAYRQLLERLRIDQVHVLAISAGGPSGIRFCSMYPELVKTLTFQSAVTKEWLTTKEREYKAAMILFRPEIEKFTWKLLRRISKIAPKLSFKYMSSSFSKLSYSEIIKMIQTNDINKFVQMIHRQRSGEGFLIDLSQTSEVQPVELEKISCPTLILHCFHDAAVPIEHALHAHRLIKGSQLIIVDTWGHLIWLGEGSEEVNQRVIEFLNTYR